MSHTFLERKPRSLMTREERDKEELASPSVRIIPLEDRKEWDGYIVPDPFPGVVEIVFIVLILFCLAVIVYKGWLSLQ